MESRRTDPTESKDDARRTPAAASELGAVFDAILRAGGQPRHLARDKPPARRRQSRVVKSPGVVRQAFGCYRSLTS
jgi:hypothetical protein